MEVQTALSAHTEPQGVNARALSGDRAMEMPVQHSQCQRLSALLGNAPSPGQAGGAELPLPQRRGCRAGGGSGEARVPLHKL